MRCGALSRWSTEERFLKLLDHFSSFVKCSKDEWVLLVLDNHDSHLFVESVSRTSDAGIVMVTFPSHTSNKLYCADLTVSEPLQSRSGYMACDHPGVTSFEKRFSMYISDKQYA